MNPPQPSPPQYEGQPVRRMKGHLEFSCGVKQDPRELREHFVLGLQRKRPKEHTDKNTGPSPDFVVQINIYVVVCCVPTSWKWCINHLYEGRRERISLRFWESVTLSTDSCESSLSAMVEIWNKLKKNSKLGRNAPNRALTKQHVHLKQTRPSAGVYRHYSSPDTLKIHLKSKVTVT